MQLLGLKLAARVEQVLQHLDADGNGEISYIEFETFVDGAARTTTAARKSRRDPAEFTGTAPPLPPRFVSRSKKGTVVLYRALWGCISASLVRHLETIEWACDIGV